MKVKLMDVHPFGTLWMVLITSFFVVIGGMLFAGAFLFLLVDADWTNALGAGITGLVALLLPGLVIYSLGLKCSNGRRVCTAFGACFFSSFLLTCLFCLSLSTLTAWGGDGLALAALTGGGFLSCWPVFAVRLPSGLSYLT